MTVESVRQAADFRPLPLEKLAKRTGLTMRGEGDRQTAPALQSACRRAQDARALGYDLFGVCRQG